MNLTKNKIDIRKFRHRKARESDVSKWIESECSVKVDGLPGIHYAAVEGVEEIREMLCALKFSKNIRASGLMSRSRVFGTMPRRPMQRADFCNWASLDVDAPHLHKALVKFAKVIERQYKAAAPFLFGHHLKKAKSLLESYRVGVFTSGIINHNNQLPYHFDSGNVPSLWSAMLTLKMGCDGGDLVLPQIDTGIRLRDSTLLFFDGQSLMHGVTPFQLSDGGHRFTIVYYTMAGIWKCLPPSAELARAQMRETERNERRAHANS